MQKYIHDCLKNNTRSITKDLTKPQRKAVEEMIRGLFTCEKPILRHMVQNSDISAKKQAEKYSCHLGNIDIAKEIDRFALKRAKNKVKQDTIIAYDLSDISKECAKKMEKIARVFDGSKRRITNGYTLHGVGINCLLTRFKIHNGDKYFQNQTRREIVTEIAEKVDRKGIWVFDRGNDDKQFFKFLSSELRVRFIARLKENRQVVLKKTGDKIQVKYLKPGKYRVYLMDKNNYAIDSSSEYTLTIQQHLKNHEPIRLISNLSYQRYSKCKTVTMYLERWGVENIFKRIKTKFGLEKIRVLSYKKLINLVALTQLAVIISTLIFTTLQKSTAAMISGLLLLYKRFMKTKSLSLNLDSFITFLKDSLDPIVFRNHSPPTNQLPLFSRRQVEKMGSF